MYGRWHGKPLAMVRPPRTPAAPAAAAAEPTNRQTETTSQSAVGASTSAASTASRTPAANLRRRRLVADRKSATQSRACAGALEGLPPCEDDAADDSNAWKYRSFP